MRGWVRRIAQLTRRIIWTLLRVCDLRTLNGHRDKLDAQFNTTAELLAGRSPERRRWGEDACLNVSKKGNKAWCVIGCCKEGCLCRYEQDWGEEVYEVGEGMFSEEGGEEKSRKIWARNRCAQLQCGWCGRQLCRMFHQQPAPSSTQRVMASHPRSSHLPRSLNQI